VTDRVRDATRNTHWGDSLASWDLRISRYFTFREHNRIDFAVDAFNALNRASVDEATSMYGTYNFCNGKVPVHYRDAAPIGIETVQNVGGCPAVGPPVPNPFFGGRRTMFNPRQLQFSLKYSFWGQRCGNGGGKKGAMPVTFKDVRKLALALQNVEEGTSYGTPAFKVDGKLIARLKEDGESLVVGTTFEEREEMMAAEPDTYYITDHYLKYPWVLVHLSRVHADALRDLLSRSWRLARAQPRRTSTRKRAKRPR
jgi:hypothetical protein